MAISVFCLVSGVRCLLPSFFCLLSGVRGLYGTFERFSRVPNSSGPKSCFMFAGRVCIQDQSFTNFENDTMKLSVNEAKLTGLGARNCATIQQVLISKFAFAPEKLLGFSRNGPKVSSVFSSDSVV